MYVVLGFHVPKNIGFSAQNFACSSLTSYTYPVLLSTRTVVQDMYKHIPRYNVIYLGILHYLGTPWGGTAARTDYLGIPGMGTYARKGYLGIPSRVRTPAQIS